MFISDEIDDLIFTFDHVLSSSVKGIKNETTLLDCSINRKKIVTNSSYRRMAKTIFDRIKFSKLNMAKDPDSRMMIFGLCNFFLK
ncbi:hypothetical protein DERP_013985 [Dermatophagoides pteronyssinus]|uniref:Uncharacterized protein n=1 Tax=Dermatophagoides pteronyssinus TaxID=6956 RepID=A0ABQ8IRQ0_DERPT|nr:hypothetical protein DERP_013985 [Dermatophagoides pteronyssinus]